MEIENLSINKNTAGISDEALSRQNLCENILSHTSDHMCVMDYDKHIIYANKAMETFYGLNYTQYFGKKWDELGLSHDPFNLLTSPAYETLDNEQLVLGETSFASVDGVLHYFENYLEPVMGQNGNIEFFVLTSHDISKNRKEQEKLRSSYDQLQQIIDCCANNIYVKDFEGKFILTNRDMEIRYGKTKEWFKGKTSYDIHTKEKADWYSKHDRETWKRGETVVYEEEFESIDGKRNIVLSNKFLLYDKNNKPCALGGISTDITRLKGIEKALQESQATLAAGLSSITDAVVITDKIGCFIDFNDAWVAFHRFKDKASCPKTVSEITNFIEVSTIDGSHVPPDQWSSGRALRGETATNQEYIIRRKDTGETWVGSYSLGPIRDNNGAIVGSVLVARDVTKHKAMEAALKKSEERYRKYFELGLVGMAIESPEGYWVEVNNRLCELLRYSHDELIGKHWKDLTHPEDLARNMEEFKKLQDGEIDHYSLEKRFIRKDGEILHSLLSVGCSRFKNDEISDIYIILEDVTAEKQYKASLAKARDDLMVAIREVLSGNQYIRQVINSIGDISGHSPSQPEEDPMQMLTFKQREVLRLVAKGNTSEEIATKLCLSKHTVDYHRICIMKKLGLRTQFELLRFCAKAGVF